MGKSRSITLLCVLALFTFSAAAQAQFILTNSPGDGTVTVKVDGYGSFGLALGPNSSDAMYDPVGAGGPTPTTFDSGVAIRFGSAGGRGFLTSGSIGGSGGLPNIPPSGTPTLCNNTFLTGGLTVNLTQALTPLMIGSSQAGSILTQTYNMFNVGNRALDFELIRYLDGDLRFDGSLVDGGGKSGSGAGMILFETDSATGVADPTTFVGISASGGTIPLTDRYEIDSFAGLRSRIIAGTALDDTITNDGNNDGFIDAGAGYDVTMALRNLYSLGIGQSAVYTTVTYFGSGAPQQVSGVPEPGSLALLVGIAVPGALLLRRRRK